MNHRPLLGLALTLLSGLQATAGTTFRIKFNPATRPEPATGRLVLMLIKDGTGVAPGTDPLDGPFWGKNQPMFGTDVKDLAPNVFVNIDDSATSFPDVPSKLAPGTYHVQARLDVVRRDSEWKREKGNLFSKNQTFTVTSNFDKPVEITLDQVTPGETQTPPAGCEVFEVRSKLLSDFRGYDVMLRAAVVLPTNRDAGRSYPAVYEVPGFGGNHTSAYRVAQGMGRGKDNLVDSPKTVLHASAFWITLDPESSNGHTLFADSANNGPCGKALVEELIPALEKKYNLAAKPAARLLRGHSSGGWSTLWLAITYPETFGATWSTSPDPVDFRRFQVVDIYGQPNMYTKTIFGEHVPAERPSTREGGRETMTIREENTIEEVIGPKNTSSQQWDSWQAVFGPREKDGKVAALYDARTGMLDKAVAETYRDYDIAEIFRKEPGKIGVIFHQRVRLIVGDQDTFYLNEAVALLKPEVEKLSFFQYPEGRNGYIKIVPGKDHGNIFATPEMNAVPAEMVEHLKKNGLIEARAAK